MHSPVGFGVYGEQYIPEIVELTEEDLSPLSAGSSSSWVTPSQFSGGFFTTARGTVLGVSAGVLAGIAAEQIIAVISLENPLADYLLNLTAVPAIASIATLASYGFFS